MSVWVFPDITSQIFLKRERGLAFVKEGRSQVKYSYHKTVTITTPKKTTTKGYKETFGGDECVHPLDCGDGITSVYKYLNSLHCTP